MIFSITKRLILYDFLRNLTSEFALNSVYEDLLFFYFPKQIRQSIYTSNLIESLNK